MQELRLVHVVHYHAPRERGRERERESNLVPSQPVRLYQGERQSETGGGGGGGGGVIGARESTILYLGSK